jgi:hypothetical protein
LAHSYFKFGSSLKSLECGRLESCIMKDCITNRSLIRFSQPAGLNGATFNLLDGQDRQTRT